MTTPHRSSVPARLLRRAGTAVAVALLLTGCGSTDVSDTVGALYEHAQGVAPERAQDRQLRDVAMVEWAVELGLAKPFSVEDIEASLAGDGPQAAYGARTDTLWEAYVERIEHDAQLVRSQVRDGLSMDEVRAYYDAHPEHFERQDVLTVEITEWEGGRALSSYEVTIDESTVRMLQELDDAVVGAALTLEAGEVTTVDRGDGRAAQVECVSREDAGRVPFEDVVQAAASQLADERVEEELARRVEALREEQG